MNKFVFPCITLLMIYSCNVSSNDKKDTVQNTTPASRTQPLKLFTVDSVYYPYFPDTTFVFKSQVVLSNYFLHTNKTFDNFCKKRLLESNNSDSVKLANITATHHWADLMEYLYFKYCKGAPKDNLSMHLLSFFSPYSEIIPLKERYELFNSFPEEMRSNEVGKKTLQKLQEYTFEKNTGSVIAKFDTLKLKDISGHVTFLSKILDDTHKYYVIILGASWCMPCRQQEFQLRNWIKAIDTSKVKLIGLSVDTKEDAWRKHVQQEKNSWGSYLLEGGWDNALVKELGVDGIPTNFLIDTSKKIISQQVDVRKVLRQIPFLNVD